ncbi:tRNA-splicing endonuclease subunit Sen34 [Hypomesus transpacificus]|uniref:tRNA-splicing endonuclease subunit Sen34 n=1 Tax=Hypomesus transpacificus TaxID=137520 RepID=UPI001F07795C|nr:tRNA-splicing endonuclease subunit Sen34 [Hypomesus transpacificus]
MAEQSSSTAPELLKRNLDERDGEGETTENGPKQILPVIGINFCESTPLVWRADEVKAARERGIIGSLVGSLARQPRQNCRLGRPLELTEEEGRLLVDIGEAVRIPPIDPQVEAREVSRERVDQYHADLDRTFEEQKALALEDRKACLLRVMSGKQDDSSLLSRLDDLQRSFSFPRAAMTVQLCTASAGLQYGPEERDFLSAAQPVPRERGSDTRFLVFRDLRQRGFCLTSAGKFGGDFLVYPGDPLRFHAHFIAVCLDLDESLPLSDVLTVARLGSNVKKTVLLCSPAEEEVLYTSLQWSGMI